jgi:hypothetical protein
LLCSDVIGDRNTDHFGESSTKVALAVPELRCERSDIDDEVGLLDATTQRGDGGERGVGDGTLIGLASSAGPVAGTGGVGGCGEEFDILA